MEVVKVPLFRYAIKGADAVNAAFSIMRTGLGKGVVITPPRSGTNYIQVFVDDGDTLTRVKALCRIANEQKWGNTKARSLSIPQCERVFAQLEHQFTNEDLKPLFKLMAQEQEAERLLEVTRAKIKWFAESKPNSNS